MGSISSCPSRERWIGESRSRALRWDDVGPLQVVRLYRSAGRGSEPLRIIDNGRGRRASGQWWLQRRDGGRDRGLRRPLASSSTARRRTRRGSGPTPIATAAAGAGGRAARRQGPSAARRGRAEGRGHRPGRSPRRDASSTSTTAGSRRRPAAAVASAAGRRGRGRSPTGLDRMLASAIAGPSSAILHLRPAERRPAVWPVSPARHYAGPTTSRRSLGEVAWLVL